MDFIPVNEPLLSGNEKKYLLECIDTGWISSEGPFVRQFEEQMSRAVGRKYGIAVSNGTAALEVAMQAIGIGEGDEVIMPTLTIISCAMAVTKLGGVPVLVDSDMDTWNMDVSQIESKITARTKAILAVHIYGLPVKMNAILELAGRYGLKVVEDAAEMIGQTYKGRPCGSFGDISTFSFYANKHVTTGEGGMVVTDDRKLAERCQMLRNLCFRKEERYVHDEVSGNYRFTNLQAAVGLAQLECLNMFVEKKREMGRFYTQNFKDIKGIRIPVSFTDCAENIYWVYGIVLDNVSDVTNRDIVQMLAGEGIGARTFFWCLHEQPIYQKRGVYKNQRYENAEYLARKGFYIPSGLGLTKTQMKTVVEKTIKVLEKVTEREM